MSATRADARPSSTPATLRTATAARTTDTASEPVSTSASNPATSSSSRAFTWSSACTTVAPDSIGDGGIDGDDVAVDASGRSAVVMSVSVHLFDPWKQGKTSKMMEITSRMAPAARRGRAGRAGAAPSGERELLGR